MHGAASVGSYAEDTKLNTSPRDYPLTYQYLACPSYAENHVWRIT